MSAACLACGEKVRDLKRVAQAAVRAERYGKHADLSRVAALKAEIRACAGRGHTRAESIRGGVETASRKSP